MHLFRTFVGYIKLPTVAGILRKKIRTAARKLQENSTKLSVSVKSLINVVFDKNMILATFSFTKRQEPRKPFEILG